MTTLKAALLDWFGQKYLTGWLKYKNGKGLTWELINPRYFYFLCPPNNLIHLTTMPCSLSLFLGINHFINCIHGDWKTCTVYSPPATVVFILFLLFEVSYYLVSLESFHLLNFRVFCLLFLHRLCLELKYLQFGMMKLESRHSKKKRWCILYTQYLTQFFANWGRGLGEVPFHEQ